LVRDLHISTVGELVASGVGEEVLVGARVGDTDVGARVCGAGDADGRDEPVLGGSGPCGLVG
jgi:hypothetical protein